MAELHLEVLVEPFRENDPGPHVQAVLAELVAAGLEPDMGPFATTADGEAETIAGVLGDLVNSAMAAGATAIQLRIAVG